MPTTTPSSTHSLDPLEPTEPYDPLPLAVSLLRCPSVAPDDGGAMDLLATALGAGGFDCRRLDFEDCERRTIHNLVAHLGRGAPHVAFVGHIDVVPPGVGWSVDPFAGAIKDGALYGRGACDMKGAIACFLAAVARFVETRPHGFPGTISVLLTGDEECDSEGGAAQLIPHLASRGELPDLCIVGEPTSRRTPGDTIKIGRRGQLSGSVQVRGRQGHSAYPERADNPLPRLIRFLGHLTDTPLDHGSADFAPSTLSVTSIDVDNPATNITPALAETRFDVRFNDCHTRSSLESRLRRLAAAQLGDEYRLDLRCSAEPFLCPRGPSLDVISRAAADVVGRPPVLDTGGGTSDARFIHPHCPVIELGLVGETMHRADERVPLADLDALTAIYTHALTGLLRAGMH